MGWRIFKPFVLICYATYNAIVFFFQLFGSTTKPAPKGLYLYGSVGELPYITPNHSLHYYPVLCFKFFIR